MKKLDPVPPPYIDLHRTIVANMKKTKSGKKNKTLNRLKVFDKPYPSKPTEENTYSTESKIFKRYKEFEDAVTSKKIHELSECEEFKRIKDDLAACYSSNITLKNVKEKLKQTNCPYCGITRPNQWDHYLPSSKFPELFVHALNLVHCCSGCNGIKNNFWIDENKKQRLFIHVYSDAIPDEQYLFATLQQSPESVGVTFEIKKPKSCENWDVIESHYDELSLIENYNKNSCEVISTVLDLWVRAVKTDIKYGVAAAQLKAKLIDTIKDSRDSLLEKNYGRNHWHIILHETLLESEHFLMLIMNKAFKMHKAAPPHTSL